MNVSAEPKPRRRCDTNRHVLTSDARQCPVCQPVAIAELPIEHRPAPPKPKILKLRSYDWKRDRRPKTRLQALMWLDGRTATDIAREVGLTLCYLSRAACGIGRVSNQTQKRIACALGKTVEDVFGSSEIPATKRPDTQSPRR